MGRFGTELEAAQAYDRAAVYLLGPQADLNFTAQAALEDRSILNNALRTLLYAHRHELAVSVAPALACEPSGPLMVSIASIHAAALGRRHSPRPREPLPDHPQTLCAHAQVPLPPELEADVAQEPILPGAGRKRLRSAWQQGAVDVMVLPPHLQPQLHRYQSLDDGEERAAREQQGQQQQLLQQQLQAGFPHAGQGMGAGPPAAAYDEAAAYLGSDLLDPSDT